MIRSFSIQRSEISKGTEKIQKFLEKEGIKGKEAIRWVLVSEEIMGELFTHAAPDRALHLRMRSILGSISLEFSVPGEEFGFDSGNIPDMNELWAVADSQAESSIRSRILLAYMDELDYRHRRGVNKFRIAVRRPSAALAATLGSLLAAVLLGILLAAVCPDGAIQVLDTYLLIPIKTMYMNVLKVLAAPVVFFSIASCISQMGNPADLSRIGSKVVGLYLITSVAAVILGIGVFYLLSPGNASLSGTGSADIAAASQTLNISIKDIIVGIVPDNFLSPFLESNMLQILFLAILSGSAIGLIGDYSGVLRDLFHACNDLFLKMTSIIMRVTPIAIFCSILSLILNVGASSLLSLVSMIVTFLLGLVCLTVVYSLILLFNGINPVRFLRSYTPVMLQVFSIASSNASIPLNMDFCKEKLGISPRVYAFSIPLGATINMDGMCILLAVESLTLAKIYGVPVPGKMLLPLALSIIILSIGTPGIPGAGVIMLSMLVTQLGVPVESVALFMGIGPLMGMFVTASNCLGDVVATAAVARSEKN